MGQDPRKQRSLLYPLAEAGDYAMLWDESDLEYPYLNSCQLLHHATFQEHKSLNLRTLRFKRM